MCTHSIDVMYIHENLRFNLSWLDLRVKYWKIFSMQGLIKALDHS